MKRGRERGKEKKEKNKKEKKKEMREREERKKEEREEGEKEERKRRATSHKTMNQHRPTLWIEKRNKWNLKSLSNSPETPQVWLISTF